MCVCNCNKSFLPWNAPENCPWNYNTRDFEHLEIPCKKNKIKIKWSSTPSLLWRRNKKTGIYDFQVLGPNDVILCYFVTLRWQTKKIMALLSPAKPSNHSKSFLATLFQFGLFSDIFHTQKSDFTFRVQRHLSQMISGNSNLLRIDIHSGRVTFVLT